MHELSIVLGIVDLAEQQLAKNGGKQIHEIELEIGYLAGVSWDALEFAWQEGVKGTVLEQSERKLNKIKGQGVCLDCDREFEVKQQGTTCPHCGSYLIHIEKGKELRVVSLLVD